MNMMSGFCIAASAYFIGSSLLSSAEHLSWVLAVFQGVGGLAFGALAGRYWNKRR